MNRRDRSPMINSDSNLKRKAIMPIATFLTNHIKHADKLIEIKYLNRNIAVINLLYINANLNWSRARVYRRSI